MESVSSPDSALILMGNVCDNLKSPGGASEWHPD